MLITFQMLSYLSFPFGQKFYELLIFLHFFLLTLPAELL